MNNPYRHKALRETPEVVILLWDYSKKLEERTDSFLGSVIKLKTEFNRRTLEDKKKLNEEIRRLAKRKMENENAHS